MNMSFGDRPYTEQDRMSHCPFPIFLFEIGIGDDTMKYEYRGVNPLCKCGCGKDVEWNFKSSRWNKYVSGHFNKMRSREEIIELQNQNPPLCKCGCRKPVLWNPYKRKWGVYINGHANSVRNKLSIEDPPLCACGCGEKVSMSTVRAKWNRYVNGHRSMLGIDISPEGRKRMGDAQRNRAGYKLTKDHKAKISVALKGRKGVIPGEETRRKMSKAKLGKPTWNTGIELSSDHKSKLSLAHKGQVAWNDGMLNTQPFPNSYTAEYRLQIRERDNNTCQVCCLEWSGSNYKMKFVIHHIDQNRENNHEDNLLTICNSCHGKVHAYLFKNNIKKVT